LVNLTFKLKVQQSKGLQLVFIENIAR